MTDEGKKAFKRDFEMVRPIVVGVIGLVFRLKSAADAIPTPDGLTEDVVALDAAEGFVAEWEGRYVDV